VTPYDSAEGPAGPRPESLRRQPVHLLPVLSGRDARHHALVPSHAGPIMDQPEEDDQQTRRHRAGLPMGLLGMLAIVVGFESFVARHDVDFTELSAADWRLTRSAASADAKNAKLLVFGDSLLKLGVVPAIVERRTGLETFNLSVLGGQSPSSYFLLRRALGAGARPTAVFLDCQDLPSVEHFDGRGLSLWAYIRSWPELISSRDWVELCWSARDGELLGATGLRRLLPSLKARAEVRGQLFKLLVTGSTDTARKQETQRRNWRSNRGSILMAPRPSNPSRLSPENLATPVSRWSLDPVTREFLRKFLTLAAENQIQVFWLLPPMTPEVEGLRERIGQHAYYTRLSEELQAEYPGLIVVDGRGSSYGRGVFIDDSHLDREGAVSFTSDLAEIVARSLEPGRPVSHWVRISRYTKRTAPGSIEDMEESRLALESERKARR
jgi:hypothetical protein